MLSRTGWARSRRRRKPLPASSLAILEEQFAYYHCLPSAEQAALRGMLQVLLGELTFEPGAGLDEVGGSMRLLIAAQAAVLLLHRPLADLPDVRTVIVYPGVYQAHERTHTLEGVEVEEDEVREGEAWAHGAVLLSWEDVAYDAQHVDDGHNVVFHEVAHALDAQTGESDGVPLLPDREVVEAWRAAFGSAYEELTRGKSRRRGLLDRYAAEDPAEFFAVATEAFLESPDEFRSAYPALYVLLRDFYGLDPATWAACLSAASRDG
jgi:Mlc titration factor MtfA (ptsG expression regulator)